MQYFPGSRMCTEHILEFSLVVKTREKYSTTGFESYWDSSFLDNLSVDEVNE